MASGQPARRRGSWQAVPALLTAAVLLGAGTWPAALGSPPPPRVIEQIAQATGSAPSRFAVVAERPRPRTGGFTVAELRRPVWLRDAPAGGRIARLDPRTEFGSKRVLSVVRRRGGWLGVVAPQAGNGRIAWIAERVVVPGYVEHSIRVDLSARQLELRRGGRVVMRAPVAIGRTGSETPTGRSAVTDKLLMGGRGSPYGCCALALTTRQPRIPQGWTGGDRVAVHGTANPASIGTAASLGCLRAAERHMRRLVWEVPLGTPVVIRP